MAAAARPGRHGAQHLGRGQPAHRGGQRLHRQKVRPRPRDRLLAHPGHVHGQLRRRLALPLADWRRVHELLRLVLRPAAGQPADLGRADRRARIGRLVQLHLHHRLGLQRAPDPHARRPLLHRSPLQGCEDRGDHARLRRDQQALRPVDAPQAGHGRGDRHGHGPRDPQGVLFRQALAVLRRLRAPLHRHAQPGAAGRAHPARRPPGGGARPLPARQRLQRQARPGQQPRVENGRDRPGRQDRAAQRLHRLPLGRRRPHRRGQVEPGRQGSARRRTGQAQAQPDGRRGQRLRSGLGGLPVFRRYRHPQLHGQQAGQRHRRRAGAPGAGAPHQAGQGR